MAGESRHGKGRPENRHRMVRVEDDLWAAAGEAAAAEGTTRSEVMRAALVELVERHTHGPSSLSD